MSKEKPKTLFRDDLKPGLQVDIYENYLFRDKVIGKAELLEYAPEKHTLNEFDIDEDMLYDARTNEMQKGLWKIQCWKVKFDDDFITYRCIPFFEFDYEV